jgi:hypothetical protein
MELAQVKILAEVGYISVAEIMTLRLTCKTFLSAFPYLPGDKNNNVRWFLYFKMSCVNFSEVHLGSLDPGYMCERKLDFKDCMNYGYYHNNEVVPQDANGFSLQEVHDLQRLLESEAIEIESDWDSSMESDSSSSCEVYRQMWGEEVEIMSDSDEYCDNWPFDETVDWFQQCAHDANMFTFRQLWQLPLAVSADEWRTACYCDFVGSLDIWPTENEEEYLGRFVEPPLNNGQKEKLAEMKTSFDFNDEFVDSLPKAEVYVPALQQRESLNMFEDFKYMYERYHKPDEEIPEEEIPQLPSQCLFDEFMASRKHVIGLLEPSFSNVLDAVAEVDLVWFFAVSLMMHRLGHGAQHLDCRDYFNLRHFRADGQASTSLVSNRHILNDMIEQVHFAAVFAKCTPVRVASLFRTLFCVLHKFTQAEIEGLVELMASRFPSIWRLATQSGTLTSLLTLNEGSCNSTIHHWTEDFRHDHHDGVGCDFEEDEGEIPDEVILHNDVHAIMARAGVLQAFPETCEEGLKVLREYLHDVVESICKKRNATGSVTGKDVKEVVKELEADDKHLQDGVAMAVGWKKSGIPYAQQARVYPFYDADIHPDEGWEEQAYDDEEEEDDDEEELESSLSDYFDDAVEIDENPEPQLFPHMPVDVANPGNITRWAHKDVRYTYANDAEKGLLLVPNCDEATASPKSRFKMNVAGLDYDEDNISSEEERFEGDEQYLEDNLSFEMSEYPNLEEQIHFGEPVVLEEQPDPLLIASVKRATDEAVREELYAEAEKERHQIFKRLKKTQ